MLYNSAADRQRVLVRELDSIEMVGYLFFKRCISNCLPLLYQLGGNFSNRQNKVCVYVLSLLILASFPLAQPSPQLLWSKTYPPYRFMDITRTSVGTYTLLGEKKTPDLPQLWVMGIDSTGNTLWERAFGDTIDELYAQDIRVTTTNDGYIVAGNKWNRNLEHFWILRLNQNGDSIWSCSLKGRDSAYEFMASVIATNDSCFLGVGSSNFPGLGKVRVFITKINARGDTLWTRYLGGQYGASGNDVVPLSDGGFMVAGLAQDSSAAGMKEDFWMLRLNGQGDTLWTRKMGDKNDQLSLTRMKQTPDNGFIVTGTESNIDTNQRDVDGAFSRNDTLFVLKLNSNGEKQWKMKFDKADQSEGYSIDVTPDSGYIICGTSDSGDHIKGVTSQLLLMRLNSQGTMLWSETYGSGYYNSGNAVVHSVGDKYVAAGYTADSSWILEIQETINNHVISYRKTSNQSNEGLRSMLSSGFFVDLLGRKLKYINTARDLQLGKSKTNSMVVYRNTTSGYTQKMTLSK
jgi:hypothetical protein